MDRITDRVATLLRLQDPQGTPTLARQLGVSASTIQRALRRLPDRLTTGHTRGTRHALRRPIEGVTCPIPVIEVLPAGQRCLGELHPVYPAGFWFEATQPGQSTWYDDLPWFLYDLRPAGYLGRQIPLLYPAFPRNILLWSADEALRYLTHHGIDGVGALLVGREAILAMAEQPTPPSLSAADRPVVYPELAARALQLGPVGSSAGGEQPKFLARVDDRAVLVKFSPSDDGAAAARWTDLLIAEHHALASLASAGHPAARSTLIQAGGRTFLEVERFDRIAGGRRGLVMLTAVDAEFVGLGQGWVPVMRALADLGCIDADDLRQTQWRALFGAWIANTDQHLGNLSLYLNGIRLAGLAPAYDVLPMAYAPVAGEVVPYTFVPTLQTTDGALAREVWQAAVDCWGRIADDDRISPSFRAIAQDNGRALHGIEAALDRLPRS